MVILVVAAVWLVVRVIVALRMAIRCPDQMTPAQDHQTDWSGPHDAAAGPQDARCGPQDSAPADLDSHTRSLSAPSAHTGDPTLLSTAVLWRVTDALREAAAAHLMPTTKVGRDDGSQVLAGKAGTEWVAAFREAIVDRIPRPEAGPACLGGRDGAVYMRGWDDAVDWIGQGHDAKGPSWGDVAYMTGWNDAVRDVARARTCSREIYV